MLDLGEVGRSSDYSGNRKELAEGGAGRAAVGDRPSRERESEWPGKHGVMEA